MTPLIDTNVLVRFLTGDQDPKYEALPHFFFSLESGEKRVELKLIVLFQVIFVLTSFYKIPRERVADALIELCQYRGIKIRRKRIVQEMLLLWRDHGLDIVDCYLIATLGSDPQNLLYSYDRDFDRFGVNRKEP